MTDSEKSLYENIIKELKSIIAKQDEDKILARRRWMAAETALAEAQEEIKRLKEKALTWDDK